MRGGTVRLCPNIDVVASMTASGRMLAHFIYAPRFDVNRLLLTLLREQAAAWGWRYPRSCLTSAASFSRNDSSIDSVRTRFEDFLIAHGRCRWMRSRALLHNNF